MMYPSIPVHIMNIDTTRIQYFAIFGCALIFLLILELTRKGKIKISYFLLWFFLSAGFMVISIWRGLLEKFAVLVGIAYAPAALFLILILGIIGILVHFSIVLSKLSERNCKLVQEIGTLKLEIDNLKSPASHLKQ